MVTMATITGKDITSCPHCQRKFAEEPALLTACASVGMSHDETMEQTLFMYLVGFHLQGHPGYEEE